MKRRTSAQQRKRGGNRPTRRRERERNQKNKLWTYEWVDFHKFLMTIGRCLGSAAAASCNALVSINRKKDTKVGRPVASQRALHFAAPKKLNLPLKILPIGRPSTDPCAKWISLKQKSSEKLSSVFLRRWLDESDLSITRLPAAQNGKC